MVPVMDATRRPTGTGSVTTEQLPSGAMSMMTTDFGAVSEKEYGSGVPE